MSHMELREPLAVLKEKHWEPHSSFLLKNREIYQRNAGNPL